MVTEGMASRRAALGLLGGLGLAPWLVNAATRAAPAQPSARLLAAWDGEAGFEVGILAGRAQGALGAVQSIAVPTRAHGLLALADDALLAVARRPGDWLLRWSPHSAEPAQWQWAEPGRAFNGHAIASPDGQRLYTTETDLDSGASLVGVRDARSLAKMHEWPTFGIDAHELLWDASSPAGPSLIVANGGVPTRPETGRAKIELERMDSSLVRLDAASGKPQGQWRLEDRRLSLRHLAWQDAAGAGRPPLLGVALQAEHDDPVKKSQAPVLALFDGARLRPALAPVSLAGYGGAICAVRDGWAIGCPRAHGIALFGLDGAWHELVALSQACAVTSLDEGCWAGGENEALRLGQGGEAAQPRKMKPASIRLDNHWTILPNTPRRA